MALGLSMALIVNQRSAAGRSSGLAFYFPSIASSVAITSIAIYILSADGLLNRIIGGHRSWFGDPSTALWSIVGLNAWTTAGTVMLFYLAALQAISDRRLRGGRRRRDEPVADLLADHVPAA